MTLPPPNSPAWKIVQTTIRTAVLLCGLWLFYDRLDPRDLKTILTCILADAGLAGIATFTKPRE